MGDVTNSGFCDQFDFQGSSVCMPSKICRFCEHTLATRREPHCTRDILTHYTNNDISIKKYRNGNTPTRYRMEGNFGGGKVGKLKPSKLVLINNLLADLLICQTFFRQMLETSQFANVSLHMVYHIIIGNRLRNKTFTNRLH